MALVKSFTDVSSAERELSFITQDTPVYVANALRRVLLSELPAIGIPNTYRDSSVSVDSMVPGVIINTNSGRLHNEFLRHRLSLLPVALDPAKLQGNRFVLMLKKANDKTNEDPIVVTSSDIHLFQVETNGTLVEVSNVKEYLVSGASDLIPVDPTVLAVVGNEVPQGILLTWLYPDEELELMIYPCAGCARDFSGFAPLHTCTYEHLLNNGDAADIVGAPPEAETKAFRFTLQSLGVQTPTQIVSQGWEIIQTKVDVFNWMLQPNVVEVDFGSLFPSLHTTVDGII